MNSPSQLKHVMNTLASLIRSVHLKRTLSSVDPDPRLNFWRLIHGNVIGIAVLEWCRLFGSDERQLVHWKNNVADQMAFRTALLQALKIDHPAWHAYWKEMKQYRDTHVAHLDFSRPDVTHYPKLDLALESAAFYYGHVLSELRRQGITGYPDDIRKYGSRFAEQAKRIAAKALSATADIEESVH